MGVAVVEELLRHGRRVRVLSRSQPRQARVEWAEGDVTEPDRVGLAMAGCRQVIHLVAIRREWKERTFQAITAQGTSHVARAAAAAGIERLVHISALGITPCPVTGYMKAKLEAEEAVKAAGIPYTIFRPSFIVGPGGFVEEYYRLIQRAPVIPIPGSGAYPVQPVARSDVAHAIRKALEVPAAAGRTYDLAGPERVSFEGFIKLIVTAMGVRKRLVHVPLWVMFPAAWALQRLTPNAPATVEELRMLIAGNTGDTGPVVKNLGLELTPLKMAVEEAVDQLKKRLSPDRG